MKFENIFPYLVCLVWLSVLTVYTVRSTGSFTLDKTPYKIVSVFSAGPHDPYLKVPIVIAKKDIRSYAYMRSADRLESMKYTFTK